MKEIKFSLIEDIQISILKAEFDKRKIQNGKYSMRKFASDANVDPSTLSQYFKGKRKLTSEAFEILLKKLCVNQEVLDQYERDTKELKLLNEKHQEIKKRWFYYALLESFSLADFEPNTKWLSSRLGMSENSIEKALEILESTGAMRKDEERYIDTLGSVTFVDDINMDIVAGRQYQKELLEKAKDSIDQNEGHIKDHTSLCFAFNTSLMPEVKERIQTFRQEMAHFIDSTSKKDESNEVYAIQINMFPLTKK